jgi:hypothetical protein
MKKWEIEVTDEFVEWWESLSEQEREDIEATIEVLERLGPTISRPRSAPIRSSRHRDVMRELRVSSVKSADIRVFYAFDPRRMAILLIGGDKAGRWDKFYDQYVAMADRLYDEHLETLKQEGSIPSTEKTKERKRKR